jgi:hypothetical protein
VRCGQWFRVRWSRCRGAARGRSRLWRRHRGRRRGWRRSLGGGAWLELPFPGRSARTMRGLPRFGRRGCRRGRSGVSGMPAMTDSPGSGGLPRHARCVAIRAESSSALIFMAWREA